MPGLGVIGEAVHGDVTFEWKISNFFTLSNKPGDFYASASFSFADTRWYLTVYPNEVGWVGLYLSWAESGPPRTIHYRFGIKGANGLEEVMEYEYNFSEKDEGFGSPEFLSRSDLSYRKNTLMPCGVLTVLCCLGSDSLSALKDTPAKTDQAVQTVVVGEGNLSKSLLALLESGEDSDMVLEVGGKEFHAHRAILRSRSSVFRSMFAHDTTERSSGVVKIGDCDPETFHDFLTHVYSGSCILSSSSNACSLYATADKYDLTDLKEACSKFLKRNIGIEGFCHVISLAVRHGDRDLTECATNFFCDNSVGIAQTLEWQTFLAENPTVGNELFLKAMSKNIARLNVSKN